MPISKRPEGAPHQLHSINPIKRLLNGEIKRRSEVIGIFSMPTLSSAWLAHCCSSRTMNGQCSGLVA